MRIKRLNYYRSNYLLMVVLMAFLYACTEEEAMVPLPSQSTEVTTLTNGKLHFKSKASLQSLLDGERSELDAFVRSQMANGFQSLQPPLKENEEAAIDQFLSEKLARIQSKGPLYNLRYQDEYDLDLDDDLIFSSRFASILNLDRAIYVENQVYVYTTQGIFVSDIANEDLLNEYLIELEEGLLTDDSFLKKRTAHFESLQPSSESLAGTCNQDIAIESVDLMEYPVTDEITHYASLDLNEDDPCNGGGSSGGGTGGTGTSTPTTPEIFLAAKSLQLCNYNAASIWQSYFGNREKCNDYHDGTHRVQTQFWNQNFLLWDEIGTKVKYQKKRFIGWSKSTSGDYLELGINTVTYEFDHPLDYDFGALQPTTVFEYKGYSVNAQGQVVGVPAAPVNFPFGNPKDKFLTIFKYDINNSTANQEFNKLLSLAKKLLPKALNLEQDLKNNAVGVRQVNVLSTKTQVTVANKVQGGDGEIYEHNFDFAFFFEWDFEPPAGDNNSGGSGKFPLDEILKNLFAGKAFDVKAVDIYGLATKDGILKGRRIVGAD